MAILIGIIAWLWSQLDPKSKSDLIKLALDSVWPTILAVLIMAVIALPFAFLEARKHKGKTKS